METFQISTFIVAIDRPIGLITIVIVITKCNLHLFFISWAVYVCKILYTHKRYGLQLFHIIAVGYPVSSSSKLEETNGACCGIWPDALGLFAVLDGAG